MSLGRKLRASFRLYGPAVGLVGLATLPAVAGDAVPTSTAALGYVLAVALSATVRGIRAGVAASLLAFTGLNFFFTEPRLTLRVADTEDLVALIAFVGVAFIVGTLVSTARSQRHRSERREREARLLHHVATRLMAGEDVAAVLRRFGEAAADLLGLSQCEIALEHLPDPIVVRRDPSEVSEEQFAIEAAGHTFGTITVAAEVELGDDARESLRAFAAQIAFALEHLRLAGEANAAFAQAEESRLRAALFSSVTHDLRTPLASITAAVTGLQDEQARFSPDDRRALLETIRQDADRLNRLVGNIVNLAKMKAGVLAPAKQEAAIDDVVESVLDRLGRHMEGRPVRVQMRDDLGVMPIDVIQIDQALTNVIENAVKYSPSGSEITIAAVRWHDDIEVRITDRGPGIPPDQRTRVFEPFVRGDGETPAGSGLGLSIAQAIVAAHGGRMWIETAPGGGTTVVLRLPTGVPS